MKLSQVLKDWPGSRLTREEREVYGLTTVGSKYDEGFNTALESCDREIDREALEDILCHHAPMLRSEANDISHAIISNMPTWLKRSEDK